MQCLLLQADGKTPIHPSHIIVLPGDSGSGMAISFTGALRIPVSCMSREHHIWEMCDLWAAECDPESEFCGRRAHRSDVQGVGPRETRS